MKPKDLIGKGVIILEPENYYFESDCKHNYDKKQFDRGIRGCMGIVMDVMHGVCADIAVQSGKFLWRFNENELVYEGELVKGLIKEWDLTDCPTLLSEKSRWWD